jgi:LysR family transcriptional regulator, carnitine catabolism transcriptional activator
VPLAFWLVDRRQLEFFLALADAGSFTRAAGRLHIAQPSLSYAIRALEAELGAPLFERHGRGVRLTPAGEALIAPARRSVRSFALAESAVRAVTDAGFGRVTVVSSTLWAVDPLVAMIGEFRRLQPGVHFVVRDPATRSDLLEQVRSGDADFGLLPGPAPGGVLDSHRLVDQELVAVLPPGTTHRALTVSVADLVALGIIATPAGTDLRALLDDQLEAAGLAPDAAVETAHAASVIPLVLHSAGAAVLPEGMAGEAAGQGARLVRLDPPARASISLLWRRDRLRGAARHFLDLARDRADELEGPGSV